MYDSLIELVTRYLKSFEEYVERTEAYYDKVGRIGKLGGYNPFSSYKKKYQILFLLEFLEKNGIDVSGFKMEYDRVCKKLGALEEKRGKDYRDKLYEELKMDVLYYPNMINCMFDLDPVCLETENALDGRDSMEIMIMELKKDYDLKPLEENVSVLDEVFKSKYKHNIRAYLKECPSIEEPYYPENFWWRHPSKFLAN